MDVRASIPEDIALYLPGGAPIGFQSMLIGLGIDILDDGSAYRMASKHRYFVDGFIRKVDPSQSYSQVVEQNLLELTRDFEGIKYHLQENTLWTRITRDMHVHPNVASSIALLESENKDSLDNSSNFAVCQIDGKMIIVIDETIESSLTPENHYSLFRTGGFRVLKNNVSVNINAWKRVLKPKKDDKDKRSVTMKAF